MEVALLFRTTEWPASHRCFVALEIDTDLLSALEKVVFEDDSIPPPLRVVRGFGASWFHSVYFSDRGTIIREFAGRDSALLSRMPDGHPVDEVIATHLEIRSDGKLDVVGIFPDGIQIRLRRCIPSSDDIIRAKEEFEDSKKSEKQRVGLHFHVFMLADDVPLCGDPILDIVHNSFGDEMEVVEYDVLKDDGDVFEFTAMIARRERECPSEEEGSI